MQTPPLTLALLVLGIAANNAHHAAAVNNLALAANFLNRCPDFHLCLRPFHWPTENDSNRRELFTAKLA
jgi:hypothetical protein